MCKDEYVQTTDESVGWMDALVNVNDGLFDVLLSYYFVKRFGEYLRIFNCSQVRSTYVLTVKVNDRGWNYGIF